ncbi:hypothetical protein [Stenotrophomonas maltophilia]|uniref:DNA injection protein n=1 Tax=Stenotrophomonas maltophilia TaxID=40324 RepID=A0A4S2D1C3_STEMA|nr:hypothetical protein [Stenotrophomonas maltophilia]TGY35258.1 hypothetical protein E5352_05935 [Stenotrophomonas maltophilia]
MADLLSVLRGNAQGPVQGWGSLGAALAGGDRQGAYNRGMAQAAQLDQLVQTARFSREKAMEAERQRENMGLIPARAIDAGYSQGDANLFAALVGAGVNPQTFTAARGNALNQGYQSEAADAARLDDTRKMNNLLTVLEGKPRQTVSLEDGTLFDPYGAVGQTVNTTPVGQSTIGQRNASAAASYASANNSNASAARERQAMTLDRADTMGGSGGRSGMKAPSGYRWAAGGGLEYIPGGPADPTQRSAGAATEGERKAATLLARLEGSLGQMNTAIAEDEGAAKPGVLAALAGNIPFSGEAARNMVNSSERQRVEAAQLDILDAALTLGTGAAYTKEQLEGYRKSFFPQLGDTSGTVKDKQARLDNVVGAARIAAGRAAPMQVGGGVRPTTGQAPAIGTTRNGYRYTGGNPADRASWEKL